MCYNVRMTVCRGYRFKLRVDSALEQRLNTFVGHCRFVWNKALRLNLERLERGLSAVT